MRNASLPMYALPEIHKACSSFWRGIARYLKLEGVEQVPSELQFDRPVAELWSDPNLLFSQCCGYDVVRRYRQTLVPFAVPQYTVHDCAGSEYSSLIIVHEDCRFDNVLDMRDTIAVVNGPESHSGMSSLRHLVAPKNHNGRFFKQVKVSGSHVGSLRMIQHQAADIAAIDCVTYTFLAAYRPEALDGTRILGRSYHAPAPPFVTHIRQGMDTVNRIRTAIFRAFEDLSLAPARHALFLKAVEAVDIDSYQKVADFEHHAVELGYPILR
jgi:ABC-type phosphate/phosphonate transport system substrate-binding protein